MTRILAVCAFFAALVWWIVPVEAQESIRERVTFIEPGSFGCFADVKVLDISGVYHKDVILATSKGNVVVRYTTIAQHAQPDVAEVISTPENVIAVPYFLELKPNEVSTICLIEWQGM